MDENTITMIEARYEGAENEFRMWQQIITALQRGEDAEYYRTKKPVKIERQYQLHSDRNEYRCPTCGNSLLELLKCLSPYETDKKPYCWRCGQALDWSGVKK